MAESVRDYWAQKVQEDTERRMATKELAMRERRMDMARSPGSFNPWEKRGVDNYFREREQERQFDESQKTARGQWGFTDADGVHHAGGAEKVAEYDWMGKRDAGSTAAGLTAEATKHTADKNFEGIEAQAKSALEIAKEKAAAEREIAARNAQVSEENSKREWGFWDKDDYFNEGGRVAQAQAQGESAAKIAAANNNAKLEQERIKVAAKERVERLRGNAQIIASIRKNPIYAANHELAQKALESLPPEMSDEEVAEYMEFKAEKAKKAAGGEGAKKTKPTNQRSEDINRETEARKGNVGV